MKNPAPYIRRSLFALLNGSVTYNTVVIPVYEGGGNSSDKYQILIKEYTDADRSNKSNFRGIGNLVIEVVGEEATALNKHVDAIADLVMNIIKPDTKQGGLLSGDVFQVMINGKPSINGLIEDSGDGSVIIRRILRYNLLTIER
jgi:hypothetical protein